MPEEIDYAARVQRGIALLDEKWPTWAKDIDLEKLDIRAGDCCVTAQCSDVHGVGASWIDGMEYLGIEGDEEYEDYGFNAATAHLNSGDYDAQDAAYGALNGLWKAEIMKRRALDAPEASGR